VNVPDQFQEIRLRLDHDGAVPVLEEMPDPVVAAVEGAGVPGEEGPHAPGERAGARPDQKVRVVREEGPGRDGHPCRRDPRPELGSEVAVIGVVPEDGAALVAAHHHAAEDPRRIEPGLSRHDARTLA